MSSPSAETREWLEADGLGGFASGTVAGIRTRRYHALLLVATTPPTGRVALVQGADVFVETAAGRFALSSQRYVPGVVVPDGSDFLERFTTDPWPTWTFLLPDGTRIVHELFVPEGLPAVVLTWRVLGAAASARLTVRPLVSGRDFHALLHKDGEGRLASAVVDDRVVWRPDPALPAIVARANGTWAAEPFWYRQFLYAEERARGLDDVEDLASPGVFTFDLARGEAVCILGAERDGTPLPLTGPADVCARNLRSGERARRAAFPSRLHRAADAYLVRRGRGRSVIAGYPWFADWGRDAFIALRGLCLTTGRLDDARDILLAWSGAVSDGMLPNRFSDRGEPPEYNSVDAALWYVIAVHELLARTEVAAAEHARLTGAVAAILEGYARGTRHGIHLDDDGLLAAGAPGLQLTWMDARVGDRVITPRIGKPVEVQALWLNALHLGGGGSSRWAEVLARGRASFAARFWNAATGCLHDVVDVDHRPGTADGTVRPNQILAVGGLPLALLDGEQARAVVDVVEARLWTPLGLRSLAPGEPGYVPRYRGGVAERDGAYHQGTAWPWLLGPFVDAWLRVHGDSADRRREARERFLAPLLAHLDEAGLGHVSEVADAEPPHVPGGCPFQAWSVGEALRIAALVR